MPEQETDQAADISDATPADTGDLVVGEFDPSDTVWPDSGDEWEGGHE